MNLSEFTLLREGRLQPQTGTAFELKQGQRLQVIDPQGEQVSDLVTFNTHDSAEWLSSGRTFDYCETILLSEGDILYSNRSRPMLTIEADMVGRHDFLLTPCSPETFEIIYETTEYHPSCFENLHTNLARFGIEPDRIPTTFNIFMNVVFDQDGTIRVEPPLSRAGDSILLRAEMDLIVGLTACSAEQSNNYAFKPIDFRVFATEED